MSPELPDFFLSSDIPDSKADSLHWWYSLDIKTDGRDGADLLIQLHLVQDGSFAWNTEWQ